MPTRRVHVLTTVRLVVLVSMILVQRNGAQGADGQSGAVPPPALDARRLSRTAEAQLGVLPAQPLYWHIYEYTSRAAAEAARGDRGTAAEVFGRHWLYAIADDQWRPAGARRSRSSVPSRSPPTRPTPHAIWRRYSLGLDRSPTATVPGTVIQVQKRGTS